MMQPSTRATLVAIALLTLSSSALAQDAASTTTREKDGYGYVFKDDPMTAGVLGANVAPIRVLTHPIRQTLLRPRTNFVPQMLASVEQL